MQAPVRLKRVDASVAALLYKTLKLEGFFPEFEPEHVPKLFPKSGLYIYAPDAVIVEQGETGRDLFVVYEGALRVKRSSDGSEQTLATLGPGELLGEIALVRDCPRTATVVAVAQAQVFRLAFPDLQYLLKNNAALGEHLRGLAEQRMAHRP